MATTNLTIEEKAKRYDEAIEIARQIHDADRVSGIELTTCEEIFPELAESDDEKIRKALIKYYSFDKDGDSHALDNITPKQILAWLEKQGEIIKEWSEMKFNNIQTELQEMVELKQKTEQGEPKPADKVEPKFYEGEWLCENEPNNYARFIQILEIVNVQGKDRYRISRDIHKDEDVVEFGFVEKYYHRFDIKDAKDGDVLVDRYGNIGIFEKPFWNDWHSYCYLGCNGDFMCNKIGGSHDLVDTYPATKEQRDQLEKAMDDAGYIFDFEKKELKKIEQKPAWSEEDERIRKELVSVFSNREKYLIDQSLGDITVSEALAWLKKQRPSGCPEYCVMSNCSNCPYRPIVVKQNPSDVSRKEDIELTEFEDALYTTFSDIWQDYMLGKEINVVDFVREHSDELLKIANKQNPADVSKQEPIDTTDLTDFEKCFKGMCCDKNQKFVKECCVSLLELARKQIQGEQKQEWSEEDENILKDVITDVKFEGYNNDMQANSYRKINWLKSLKDRVQPQNLTVTDEELAQAKKNAYNDALDKIEYYSGNPTFDDGWSAAIWYLKKRNAQPQSQWKPSDEQMEALDDFIYAKYPNIEKYGAAVKSLYQDLKKLK